MDPGTFATHRKRMSPGLRVVIVALAFLVAMGMSELLHHGTIEYVLSLLKPAVVAVWDMIRSIASACRELMGFVDSVRS